MKAIIEVIETGKAHNVDSFNNNPEMGATWDQLEIDEICACAVECCDSDGEWYSFWKVGDFSEEPFAVLKIQG